VTGRRRASRGQTTVEFAIVLQVLILLLFLIYQGGVAWSHKLTVEQAARDAARKAVVNRSLPSSDIQAAAVTEARRTAGSLDQARLGVTVAGADSPETPNGVLWEQGDVATVTVTYPFDISILGLTIASGTLRSSTSLRME
jgi:Flp pilus assembly protein TadG